MGQPTYQLVQDFFHQQYVRNGGNKTSNAFWIQRDGLANGRQVFAEVVPYFPWNFKLGFHHLHPSEFTLITANSLQVEQKNTSLCSKIHVVPS